MVELGYALSTEEQTPDELVANTQRAETGAFDFVGISDHYHPWIDRQGNAPFVWSVLGAIAEATDEIPIGTGVTCPIQRIHPAVVAQASATAATMLGDRFFLGVGTGEKLNEHVVGERWPPAPVRMEMLEEAVGVVRDLWTGEEQTHHGEHFTVENARLYTTPDDAPPIYVAAAGPSAAAAASEFGDGIVNTSPKQEVLEAYDGDGPTYGQVTVCWGEDEQAARETAHEWWPNGAITGELSAELPTPAHFEQAAAMVDEDDVAEAITCGPNLDEHVEAIQEFVDAGFDHVYVHQVGPNQEEFLRTYSEEVLPSFD